MATNKLTKKDKLLLCVSAGVLLAIGIFVIVCWDATYTVLSRMLTGMDRVEDYIQSLGFVGLAVMVLVMVLCFFFPVIPAAPIQVACGIAYGMVGGSIVVMIAVFIGAQLLYLFRQNLRIFSSPRQIRKRRELEKMIQESDRNIYAAIIIAYLLPAIPFLVISNLAASGLKYPKYTVITFFGMIPDIITTLFLGEKLLSSSPLASVITLIAIIAIMTLSFIFNDKLVELVFAPAHKEHHHEKTEK